MLKQTVHLSLPTFAEFAERLGKSGRSDVLQEDGSIELGDIVLMSSSAVPQAARLAARLADQYRPAHDPNIVFEDDRVRIHTACCKIGTRLFVEAKDTGATRSVDIPRNGLPSVAAELVDCMGKTG